MCGVFGAYSTNGSPVLEDVYLGLCALQHRGQLSAGVAWTADGTIHVKKALGLVHEALSQNELAQIPAHAAIGHVRYATAGGTRPENCQPLGADYAQGPIALAHNGNLTNARALAAYLAYRGAIFQTTCDSETILQLVAHQPGVVPLEALEAALEKVEGAYSLVVLIDDCLIAARDPWGFRPLAIGRRGDDYFVSSESCAFDILGAEMVRDVEPGEILVIDKRGLISRKRPQKPRHYRCAFEYVYFARPDSVIDGRSVYKTRKELGATLARCAGCPKNAVVAGMPGGRGLRGRRRAQPLRRAHLHPADAARARGGRKDKAEPAARHLRRQGGGHRRRQPRTRHDRGAHRIDDTRQRREQGPHAHSLAAGALPMLLRHRHAELV